MDSERVAKPVAGAAAPRGKLRVESARERRPLAAIASVPAQHRHAPPADGRPLDPALRRWMEARFGADFAQVRLHVDADAADQAEANAYTVGERLVFHPAHYSPDTPDGQRLLAHELAHVVQQRRGGSAPTGQATLETQARTAADAVVAGDGGSGVVHVGGASAPGIMREPSGKKKRRPPGRTADVDEAAEFGPDEDSESVRRERDKQRTQKLAGERNRAGKDAGQVLAEDAEKKLGKIEDDVAGKGANQRSERRKEKTLTATERALDALPGDTLDKNRRKSAIDERQRTPDRGGKGQQQFVAGGPKLPTQDLRNPNSKRPISHARPDYTEFRRRTDGTLERVHVNLKAHKIDRMTPGQARSATREVLYQAVRNSKHLPPGERLVISFARTPSVEVQEAIKAELFRQNTPISEIRFGTVSHREEDYKPAEGREVLDTDAKSRRARLEKEKSDAARIKREKERIAKRQQREDDKRAAQYEKARKAKAKAEAEADVAPDASAKAKPKAAPKKAPVKSAPKTKAKTAPKSAPKAKPKTTPKAAPKAKPKTTPKAAPKATPNAPVKSPKPAPKATPKAAPKVAPKAATPKASAPKATPKVAPKVAPKVTSPSPTTRMPPPSVAKPPVRAPSLRGGGVRAPPVPMRSSFRGVGGRGVGMLISMAASLLASRVEAMTTEKRTQAIVSQEADPLNAEFNRRITAKSEEILSMQAANPFVSLYVNVTYDMASTESAVVAYDQILEDWSYDGTTISGVSVGYLPMPGTSSTREGSMAQGSWEVHEFETVAVPIDLAPIEDLVAHAKANGIPLAPLRAYANARLKEAGASSDGGLGARMSAYWSQVIADMDSP